MKHLKVVVLAVILILISISIWGFYRYTNTSTDLKRPFTSHFDNFNSLALNGIIGTGNEIYVYNNYELYILKEGLTKKLEVGPIKLNNINNLANGDLPFRYTFVYKNKLYYIFNDSLYVIGERLDHLINLGESTEGFFIKDGFLYYAFGHESEKTIGGIGDITTTTRKKYQFARVELSNLKCEDVSKSTFEEFYDSDEKQFHQGFLDCASLVAPLGEHPFILQYYRLDDKVYILAREGSANEMEGLQLYSMINNESSVTKERIEIPEGTIGFAVGKDLIYFKTQEALFEYEMSSRKLRQLDSFLHSYRKT